MSGEISDATHAGSIPVDPATVAQIKRELDLSDRAQITSFGEKAQRDVVAFADKVLAQTRNSEMGDTGKLLLDVIEKARGLDPADLKKSGFIERLLGSAEGRMRRFVGKFEDVAGQVERIVIDLDRHKDTLRRDISLLDDLHEETRRSIRFLEAHIQAGKSFAVEYRAGELAQLKVKAEAAPGGGNGVMAAQDYSDAVQALDRLEKRISTSNRPARSASSNCRRSASSRPATRR